LDTVLSLFKIDLGITHTLRDDSFTKLIQAAQKELEQKGITLDLQNSVDDQVLLSDYAVWKYSKRRESVGLSQNLQFRIRNRVVKARSEYAEA
jgi:hypothetical protein